MYDLLGNDVEEDAAPSAPSREVVKKNTSSKKSDAAPASADPAKAKKKKSPTGNEAALKNKNFNKDVAPPQSTATKHSKKPLDRHSRTGKTDSKKKNGPPKKRSKSNKKFSLLLLTPRKLNPRPKRKRSF